MVVLSVTVCVVLSAVAVAVHVSAGAVVDEVSLVGYFDGSAAVL